VYCAKCKTQRPPNAIYCDACGSPIVQQPGTGGSSDRQADWQHQSLLEAAGALLCLPALLCLIAWFDRLLRNNPPSFAVPGLIEPIISQSLWFKLNQSTVTEIWKQYDRYAAYTGRLSNNLTFQYFITAVLLLLLAFVTVHAYTRYMGGFWNSYLRLHPSKLLFARLIAIVGFPILIVFRVLDEVANVAGTVGPYLLFAAVAGASAVATDLGEDAALGEERYQLRKDIEAGVRRGVKR